MAEARMLLVTDERGRVVGGAHVGGTRDDGLNVGIRPLPGQRVHEVEVPGTLARLEQGHHLQMAFSGARLEAGDRLLLPDVEVVRLGHEPRE